MRISRFLDKYDKEQTYLIDLSQFYKVWLYLDFHHYLHENDFFDSGIWEQTFIPLEKLKKKGVKKGDREIVRVDHKHDKRMNLFLKRFDKYKERVVKLRSRLRKSLESKEKNEKALHDLKSLIRPMIDAVSDFFGGVAENIVQLCQEEIIELLKTRKSRQVRLGEISHGVCRHRSILFKILCDRIGIRCRVVRGYLCSNVSLLKHAWNMIHVGEKFYIVDCMNSPVTGDYFVTDWSDYDPYKKKLEEVVTKKNMKMEAFEKKYRRGGFSKEFIGSGSFSAVFGVDDDFVVKEINVQTAVKTISNFSTSGNFLKYAKKEANFLRFLVHPNIIPLYRSFSYENKKGKTNFCLVMKNMDGDGDDLLDTYLSKCSESVQIRESVIFLFELAIGLRYLHQMKVVHLDLKPGNILVNWNSAQKCIEEVRIADFGSSKVKSGDYVTRVTYATEKYCSDEVKMLKKGKMTKYKCTEKADTYSFGMIMEDFDQRDYFLTYSGLRKLKKKCFERNPDHRPNIDEILAVLKNHLILLKSSEEEVEEEEEEEELTELRRKEESKEEKKKRLVELDRKGCRFYGDKKYDEAGECWLEAAEEGYVKAQYYLGYLYETVYKKSPEAVEWYLKAAKNGNADAQCQLGLLYKTVYKKYSKAEEWWLKAAEEGHVKAQYNLGILYKKIYAKYPEAEEWYLRAAKNGEARAFWNLGLLYEDTHNHKEKALIYYKKGAEGGNEKCIKKVKRLSEEDDFPEYTDVDAHRMMDAGGSPGRKGKSSSRLRRKEESEEEKKEKKIDELCQKGNRFYGDKKYDGAEECWLEAAEEGHVEAQYNLGFLYHTVYKKYSKAEEWYLRAAKNGNADAQCQLGLLDKNIYAKYSEAEEWYLKAAKNGNTRAFWNLGVLYENIHNDKEKALIYYKKGAEGGNEKCIKRVKILSEEDDFPEYTDVDAHRMMDAGGSPGRKGSGKSTSGKTIGGRKKPRTKQGKSSSRLRRKEESEEEKKKRLDELFRKGIRFFDDKKYDEAKKCCLEAAEEGHVTAQSNLGFLYKTVYKKYSKAEEWYLRAAKKGHSTAQYNLGNLYEKIYKKYPEAEEWYLRAAKNGNSIAQNNLGYLYHFTLKKYPEAEEWYLKAARNGNARAFWNLGLLYENIHNDKEKALIYYKKGAEGGHEKCIKEVKKLSAH